MKEMLGKWISKQKALFLLTVILLAISSTSLAIHMIFGLEEAFAIGARFFILCILLGIFATLMEFSKGRNLPYFYSILGFFPGIAIF
ncbi:MAG: hypothetical protein NZ872_06455 [Archaeoglobaceae archaeon]|nr:hypothetical protein [Archaeoglobaceae archaeon]MDW8128840.1 hypothetical protein [Archaeoglobaceae archaeon]